MSVMMGFHMTQKLGDFFLIRASKPRYLGLMRRNLPNLGVPAHVMKRSTTYLPFLQRCVSAVIASSQVFLTR